MYPVSPHAQALPDHLVPRGGVSRHHLQVYEEFAGPKPTQQPTPPSVIQDKVSEADQLLLSQDKAVEKVNSIWTRAGKDGKHNLVVEFGGKKLLELYRAENFSKIKQSWYLSTDSKVTLPL
jgi:hypothetical protein